ncbi:MAG TPA: redoxin domain-containing protein [Dissulfurispiraceae bacterium]|nr:redoxin domain-containing protein [Dissulfurispiraceae bacterium]
MRAQFIVAFLLALFFLPSADADELSPFLIDNLIGKSAPDFTLQDQNGRSIALSSLHGKPVLLNFWAPWAPNSRAEVITLGKLRVRPDMKELVILGITVDKNETDAKQFVRQATVPYPVLSDPELAVTEKLYAVFMVPTTIFIDRQGVIARIFFGQQEWLNPALLRNLQSMTGPAVADVQQR